jgi:hypothetical protein
MGIEPTWDFVEPHAGFEDQERQPGRLPPPSRFWATLPWRLDAPARCMVCATRETLSSEAGVFATTYALDLGAVLT